MGEPASEEFLSAILAQTLEGIIKLEKSLENMLADSFYAGVNSKMESPVFVGSWSSNYNSWKSDLLKNRYLLIKYEDLLSKKKQTVIHILEFIAELSKTKLIINEKKLENSLKTTEFDYLKKKEKKDTFIEAITSSQTGKKINFFNLGPKNKWQKLLKEKIRKRIEESFKKEMLELGYL